MITKENFEESHIKNLQKKYGCDPGLLERVVYAFGLLEALARVQMPFLFKGGTCLMLLLDRPMRLSTDIDVIVEPDVLIDEYIDKAVKIFPFLRVDEETRPKNNNIEKRHFKFTYLSPIQKKEIYILLDVVLEHNCYQQIKECSIKNSLLLTGTPEIKVKIPDINCMLGDKFTAFAPWTTGIPLNNGKDMEIIKQMYDISTLLEEFTDFHDMHRTYNEIIKLELGYRGKTTLTPADTLRDTFLTSASIASMGKILPAEYKYYMQGIQRLRNHIFAETFTPEIAAQRAAHIMYAVSCMLFEADYTRIEDTGKYKDMHFTNAFFKPFKYFKKTHMESFAYLIETEHTVTDEFLREIQLLIEKRAVLNR